VRVLRGGMDESFVRAQMKGEDFRRLTAAFYRRVRTDDLLGPLYPPDDWEAAEQRLGDYLCFRLLGEICRSPSARRSATAGWR
jgi:truncated hemoglobin YjbI